MGRVEFLAAVNGKTQEVVIYNDKKSVANLIKYAITEKDKKRNKIGKVRYIGGIGIDYADEKKAIQQMHTIKKYYGKSDKRQAYHFIMSFAKEINDAQKIYLIGSAIAERFFCDYQLLFAVHEDTECIHIHYVVNSVSFRTGLKWHMNKKEFVEFKRNIENTVEMLLDEW